LARRAPDVVGGFGQHQVIFLMLGEITDPQVAGAELPAAQGGKAAGNAFRQGGFAVAVGAEQRDAVFHVNPERYAA